MRRLLCIYLGVPIVLAMYNGSRGTVWAPELEVSKTILLFLGCSLPLWLCLAAVAHGSVPLLRRFGLRPIWALLGTWLLSLPLGYFVVLGFIMLFGSWFPGLEKLMVGSAMVGGFGSYVWSPTKWLFLPVWFGPQYLYEWATRDVLFFAGLIPVRPQPDSVSAPAPAAAVPASTFMAKLKPQFAGGIIALEAQEHYVKVYADAGEDLVLYRFGDAVGEVGAVIEGLQVHRSYWIAQDAVKAVSPAGKTYRLTLRNGLEVPVSLSYRGAVQQHRVFQQGRSAIAPAEAPLVRAS